MNNELNNIHREVKDILSIDTQIRASIGNHTSYDNQDLIKLNLTMFLEYSSYTMERIKAYLKSLRWVSTYESWNELHKYEKAYLEIKNNVKVDLAQVGGASAIFYNVAQLRGELKDKTHDFEVETRKVYLKYLGTAVTVFSTIYVGFYNNTYAIFGAYYISTYFFLLFIIAVVFTAIFYPEWFFDVKSRN
jgi:hypothetical protein